MILEAIYERHIKYIKYSNSGSDLITPKSKELLKVIDILGRQTKEIKNSLLFYIYDDGSVEKKIILE